MKLSKHQKIMYRLLKEDKPKLLINMGRRSGKTFLLTKLAIEYCMEDAGNSIAYFTPLSWAYKKGIVPQIKRHLKEQNINVDYNGVTGQLTFENGSFIVPATTSNSVYPDFMNTDYLYMDELPFADNFELFKITNQKIKCVYSDSRFEYLYNGGNMINVCGKSV